MAAGSVRRAGPHGTTRCVRFVARLAFLSLVLAGCAHAAAPTPVIATQPPASGAPLPVARELPPTPPPELGADDPASLTRERPALSQRPAGELPLAGVKVLDLTAWWAGPAVSQVLAAMGADAIHVESLAHLDPMRLASAVMFIGRDRWWEFSGFHMQINTNKKGVTIEDGTSFAADLEFDSLTVMDFVAAIEDEFDIIISMNQQAEIETFGQLVDAVTKMVS